MRWERDRRSCLRLKHWFYPPVCRHTHTHTHTHTLMCTHSMHPSFCLSVCLHLSLSFSQHHVTGCLLSCLILFIFHVSWMFCFSAPLPHLTSDDVDKALQNSPRLMHARNTGKQPCGPAPDSALAPPTPLTHTHTHTVWSACGAAVPQLFCMCCWCWMSLDVAHAHLCLRRSQLHLPKHPRLPSRRQQRSRQSRHEFRRPALWMDSAGVCS